MTAVRVKLVLNVVSNDGSTTIGWIDDRTYEFAVTPRAGEGLIMSGESPLGEFVDLSVGGGTEVTRVDHFISESGDHSVVVFARTRALFRTSVEAWLEDIGASELRFHMTSGL